MPMLTRSVRSVTDGDNRMGIHQGARQCQCGTRLARDNQGIMCTACQKAARSRRIRPPAVPATFWQADDMRVALAEGDMGQVMRAFRQHHFHGRDIPQEVAAAWVGVSQSRLSRLENGERLGDLAKLTRWAARWVSHPICGGSPHPTLADVPLLEMTSTLSRCVTESGLSSRAACCCPSSWRVARFCCRCLRRRSLSAIWIVSWGR